ncbi:MAG: protein BatD [Flavobacteriales bacterium]|nr:protein BatD [Flavobacteriales bacterium]
MFKKLTHTIALLLLIGVSAQAQEVSFQASVDRNEIAAGEAVKYTISLENASSGGGMTTPDWGGLVVAQGPMESSSFSSINGRMSRSSSRTWYLTATQPGSYTIGSSTVRVGGGTLQTDPIAIKVSKGESSAGSNAATDQAQKRDANLFCTITLSKNKAYVGEQIIATYTLFSRYNSLQARDYDLPKLNGFWAEEVDMGQSNWEATPRTVNGLRYNVAVLKKQVLIPLRGGKLRVEPMTLNYLVNPGFFSSGTPVRIQSNTSEVSVSELPAGKPADFIGAVGDLNMEVKAGSPTVKANEAIGLSIRFSGRANLKLIDAPKLELPPDFESYDPKVNDKITVNGAGMNGSREFQYLLIPRHPGKFDLGTLSFSYFDPSSGTYKQLRSGQLTFDVQPGDADAGASVNTPMKSDVKRLGSDIRYIRTGDLQLKAKGKHLFGSWAYVLGMAVPPALILLVFLWHRRREQRLGDFQGQRRRGADKVAKQRLAAAATALEKNDREAFHDALGKALEGYFADKFNLGVAEVNAGTIKAKLGGLDEGRTAEAYIALLRDAEMARFAPMENKPQRQIYDEASAIISRIENQLRT